LVPHTGTIVALCLLNEPWTTAVGGPITLDEVKNWAKTAVDAVLAAGWQGDIWYPDGFQLTWGGWKDFLKPPQYQVGGDGSNNGVVVTADPGIPHTY